MKWIKNLKIKIKDKKVILGIVGLGYVGLPLAFSFSEKFKVIGFDDNKEKIKKLKSGNIYIYDLDNNKINNDYLGLTDNFEKIEECDFIIICVPTPLKMDKTPDLSFVENSASLIGKHLRKQQFVILESTTYPGTTNEILLPILEKESNLKVERDFGIAYSPERIDPGNKKFNINNTPKVIGSINSEFCDIAEVLYGEIINEIVKVSNCETAEAVKILENVFRNVNIALINELAIIFREMKIDIWETIEAAKTKPYGFMPFYPGPGIGGHCIPLDPYYISYRAKQFGFIPRLIQTAGEINDYMPIHIVNLVQSGLDKFDKNIRGSNIAIFGIAYKPDIADTGESPSIKIIEELKRRNAKVKIYDPLVKYVDTEFGKLYSEEKIEEIIKWANCIVFTTAHKIFKDNIKKYIDIINKKEGNSIIVDSINIINKRCFININKSIILKSL